MIVEITLNGLQGGFPYKVGRSPNHPAAIGYFPNKTDFMTGGCYTTPTLAAESSICYVNIKNYRDNSNSDYLCRRDPSCSGRITDACRHLVNVKRAILV